MASGESFNFSVVCFHSENMSVKMWRYDAINLFLYQNRESFFLMVKVLDKEQTLLVVQLAQSSV